MDGRPLREEPIEARIGPEAGFAADEEEQLLAANRSIILEGIFGCSNEVQLESAIGFARYLSQVGISLANYPLFLRLLETNNRWIVDALIDKREPHLLFSSIRPNNFLARKAFLLLSSWHPGEIYAKVLQAVMGIIECAFHDADDGYRIYRLRITDLNSIGKFLDETNDQFDDNNALVLHVLDRITRIGTYETNERKRTLAKHAFDIRIAYFDNRKHCSDIIPHLLLTRIDRERNEVRPSRGFETFLESLR